MLIIKRKKLLKKLLLKSFHKKTTTRKSSKKNNFKKSQNNGNLSKVSKGSKRQNWAGMMECKKALVESKGDIEIAIENMRKAGQAKADKKSSRIAAEGVIKINISGDKKFATLLEVNSETDFVAKDENFVKFCNEISELSARENIANLKELLSASYGETNVEEARLQLISKVGENVQIRRYEKLNSSNFGYYLHGTKIGV